MSEKKIACVDLSDDQKKKDEIKSKLTEEELSAIAGGAVQSYTGYKGMRSKYPEDVMWKYEIGDRIEMMRGVWTLSYKSYIAKKGWFKDWDGCYIPCYMVHCPEDSDYDKYWFEEDDFCYWDILTGTVWFYD